MTHFINKEQEHLLESDNLSDSNSEESWSDNEISIEESEWERKNRNILPLPLTFSSRLPTVEILNLWNFKPTDYSFNKKFILAQQIINQNKKEQDIKNKYSYLKKQREDLIKTKENNSLIDTQTDNKAEIRFNNECIKKSKLLCPALSLGKECKHQKHCLYSHDKTLKRSINSNKKEPCKFFQQNGRCDYGDNCKFNHDVKINKKEPCKSFQQNGRCNYGDKCKFAH